MLAPIAPITSKLPAKVLAVIFVGFNFAVFIFIECTSLLSSSMLFNFNTNIRLITSRTMKPNTTYQNPATPIAGLNLQINMYYINIKPFICQGFTHL